MQCEHCIKAETLCRCIFEKQRLVYMHCTTTGGGTRAGTGACVMLAHEMHRINKAQWFPSRSWPLTMTPFTQAYHCCCLWFDNAAKVFE